MALGAGLAYAALALYRNREQVSAFCSNCGTGLRDTLENSGLRDRVNGIKEKAEKVAGKVRQGADSVAAEART
jgi:hypothetical protein